MVEEEEGIGWCVMRKEEGFVYVMGGLMALAVMLIVLDIISTNERRP